MNSITTGFYGRFQKMKIESYKLLSELYGLTERHIQFAEKLKSLPEQILNRRAAENTWSALECIEHLNRYGSFYIPEIQKRIASSHTTHKNIFRSGWLGNYFAQSMLPKEKLNKMKTFPNMNPINSGLDKGVLDQFIAQQKSILVLLDKAKQVNLEKVKTGISISNLVKISLGDTFRFVIYHNIRHVAQAEKAVEMHKYI